jgi:hypothetical protein
MSRRRSRKPRKRNPKWTLADHERALRRARRSILADEAALAERPGLSADLGVIDIADTFNRCRSSYRELKYKLDGCEYAVRAKWKYYFTELYTRIHEAVSSRWWFQRPPGWAALEDRITEKLLLAKGSAKSFERRQAIHHHGGEFLYDSGQYTPKGLFNELRIEGVVLRIVDLVGHDFANRWEQEFQALAVERNAIISDIKQSDLLMHVLPLITKAALQPQIWKNMRDVDGPSEAVDVTAALQDALNVWNSNTSGTEYDPANWEVLERQYFTTPKGFGFTVRQEFESQQQQSHPPSYLFGKWPYADEYAEGTVSQLEIRISLSKRQLSHHQLKIKPLGEKESKGERQKAAAAAHYGNTRNLAPAIRNRIELRLTAESLCPYCGSPLGEDWRADHIYPVVRGGLSTLENMVAVCFNCNSGKGEKTLLNFIREQNFDIESVEQRLRTLGNSF